MPKKIRVQLWRPPPDNREKLLKFGADTVHAQNIAGLRTAQLKKYA